MNYLINITGPNYIYLERLLSLLWAFLTQQEKQSYRVQKEAQAPPNTHSQEHADW